MPALSEIHLVSDPDDLSHPFRPEMIALLDHLADPCESPEAAELDAAQRDCLEMRNDAARELPTERTSYLKVRLEWDSRIQPHSK